MMYLIPTENMESFEKKIARIRRKAERAKVDFSYKRLEPIINATCIFAQTRCTDLFELLRLCVINHNSFVSGSAI